MKTDKEANYIKEYPVDWMKVSGIAHSKNGVHFWVSSDGEKVVHT
jgi:hypothetical protein